MSKNKQKVEYRTMDLSPARSWSQQKKRGELVARLNELGQEGWILISGIEYLEAAVLMRIVEEESTGNESD